MFQNFKTAFILIAFILIPVRMTHALEDTIIAVVNDDVITLNDLKEYIDSQVAQMKLEGTSAQDISLYMETMEKNGLDRIIADKILLSAANAKEIKVEDELVDRRLEEIKRQYRNEGEFYQALLDEGISVTDIRKKIVNQIKIKRVIDQEIRSKIYVSPKEISDEYKNHFEDYQKPERINLASIFISKSNTTPEMARVKADEAMQALKEGKNFNEVAKVYSEAPSVGVFTKGSLRPEVENCVKMLETDKISDLCEIDTGYYIFQLLGRSPRELSSVSEVNPLIYQKIFQRKFTEKFNTWLGKLKKEAFIDIKHY